MKKRVAIVHDWLIGMRGGEYVLDAILELYPDADIFTLFYNKEKINKNINSHRIITSDLNKNFLIRKYYKYFLHRFPVEIEKFDLQDYDLIISSSHCVAKGVIPNPESIHFSYVHTPMRYIWDQYYNYFKNFGYLKKKFIDKKLNYLRLWDVASSNRVDYFIANSNFVSKRIEKFYKRDSKVIHPPVDIGFFTPDSIQREDFYLSVNALVPYKRVDLLIKAFNKSGKNLMVIGDGSEYKRLRSMANSNIVFIKSLKRDELRDYYRRAKALVFAGIEDFGISFVEAQATGLPVIAYNSGGVRDIVIDKKTGLLFESQDEEEIVETVKEFETLKFDKQEIIANSLRFSKKRFLEEFGSFIKSKTK